MKKDMGFVPITIDDYIKKHLENNPSADEKELKTHLEERLSDYKQGIKCHCGNDIWVIGSAFSGKGCFSCITGESAPTSDYEIESAIVKKVNVRGRRHIDDMAPEEIHGFFDDEGYEINTDLIKKPSLCITCINDEDPDEEILCIMTRCDQAEGQEFICHDYNRRNN